MAKVKLSELKKKLEEEVKKVNEQEKVLNGIHEEIEILVIDMGYSQGGLANLYCLGDGYVVAVSDSVKKIEEIIMKGYVARVKAIRLIGTKRLVEVKDVKEEEDPEISEENVWRGQIEWLPPRLRFIREDGEVWWIDAGSMNFERISKMRSGTYQAYVVPATTYSRRSNDGSREYKRIRGFYYLLVEEEAQPEGQTPVSEEKLPDTVSV